LEELVADIAQAVFPDQSGANSTFVRPSFGPMPWSIFDALNREYGTEFFSEHDHRFWGFDTAEEWDKFQNQIAKGNNDDFYVEIIRYARGEPNGLIPGTIGFKKAEIADRRHCISPRPAGNGG
jgi:hypothetical protein